MDPAALLRLASAVHIKNSLQSSQFSSLPHEQLAALQFIGLLDEQSTSRTACCPPIHQPPRPTVYFKKKLQSSKFSSLLDEQYTSRTACCPPNSATDHNNTNPPSCYRSCWMDLQYTDVFLLSVCFIILDLQINITGIILINAIRCSPCSWMVGLDMSDPNLYFLCRYYIRKLVKYKWLDIV